MLHHLSIPAHEPERVAKVLAELAQGHSYPFPINPGSFIVLNDDEQGTAIEVYPVDSILLPGQGEQQVICIRDGDIRNYCGTHVALSVPLEESEILSIGQREGWRVLPCDRGFFEVIEFWLENRFMVELLTPPMLPRYLDTVRSTAWQKNFSELTQLTAVYQG
jgi:hypothetical protein